MVYSNIAVNVVNLAMASLFSKINIRFTSVRPVLYPNINQSVKSYFEISGRREGYLLYRFLKLPLHRISPALFALFFSRVR